MQIYLYDRDKDTRGQEDSLGNVDDGLRKIGGRLEIRAIDENGAVLVISADRNGDRLEIRNNGGTRATSLAVIPNCSNVLYVEPHDY